MLKQLGQCGEYIGTCKCCKDEPQKRCLLSKEERKRWACCYGTYKPKRNNQ